MKEFFFFFLNLNYIIKDIYVILEFLCQNWLVIDIDFYSEFGKFSNS